MPIHDYSVAELEPRKLTKEEIANPYEVIDDFFDYGHLPQLREALWDWLKLTVSGSYNQRSRRERANLLDLYETIEKLIEAAHIIHKRKDSK